MPSIPFGAACTQGASEASAGWYPLESDDAEAMEVVAGMVRDAVFDPVFVGPLARVHEFDVGTPVYTTNVSGPEVDQAPGLPQTGTVVR